MDTLQKQNSNESQRENLSYRENQITPSKAYAAENHQPAAQQALAAQRAEAQRAEATQRAEAARKAEAAQQAEAEAELIAEAARRDAEAYYEDFNPFRRPVNRRMTRRARIHDYRKRGFYMFTVITAPGSPRLSEIVGDPYVAEGENAPREKRSSAGSAVKRHIEELRLRHPDLFQICKCVIMPDHYHLVLKALKDLPNEVTYYIGRVHAGCTGECRRRGIIEADASLFPKDAINDQIVLAAGQRQRFIDYVADNPRRYLLRRMFPDLFTVKRNIVIDGEAFDVKGNMFLLKKPEIVQVHVRRAWDKAKRREYAEMCRQAVERGAVLLSPFISPYEKDIMKEALDAGGSIVKVEYEGFIDRLHPKGRWHDLCAEGRVLFITEAGNEAHREKIRRENCRHLNALSERLVAAHSFRMKPKPAGGRGRQD